jgi:hypothetical protein
VLFPEDMDLRRQLTATPLQPLYEEGPRAQNGASLAPPAAGPPTSTRRPMPRQMSALNIRRNNNPEPQQTQRHHRRHNRQTMDSNVVDVLDVIGTSFSMP